MEKARAVVAIHRAAVRGAIHAGVRIAMGTDSGVTPHGRSVRGLALMADPGMAQGRVREAATRNVARLLGVDDDLETIEPGKLADLVVVGRPKHVRDRRRARSGVWAAGRRAAA